MSSVPIRSQRSFIDPDRELLRVWHPGNPRRKERPRCKCSGEGGHGFVFTPKATREAEIAWQATMYAVRESKLSIEIEVELLFAMKGEQGGDLDNLVKLVLDAGNGVLWTDDKQVRRLMADVVRAPRPESIGTLLIVGRH